MSTPRSSPSAWAYPLGRKSLVNKQLWCFQVTHGLEPPREIITLASSLDEGWEQVRRQLRPGERIIGDQLPTFMEVRSRT